MAAFYVETDRCASRRYHGEPQYDRDPSLSYLANIKKYFNNPNAQLQQIAPGVTADGSTCERFSLIGVFGKKVTFSIQPYRDGFMFGWDHEGYAQERSWQYIIRDIRGTYCSGFF
jgi:hypothetical protein